MVTTITTTITTTTVTTTTTTTTTAVAGSIGAVTGIIAVITLIILLTAKELLSSTTYGHQLTSISESPWSVRASLLTERITIPIYSLLFVFMSIVVTEVITILQV